MKFAAQNCGHVGSANDTVLLRIYSKWDYATTKFLE